MISSIFSSISLRVMPKIAPFRYTFSRPVNSGWNPVPTSSIDATLPFKYIFPAVGAVIRVINFNSVDLPAPLCPIIPTASPFLTSKDTPFSARNLSLDSFLISPILSVGSSRCFLFARALCSSSLKVVPPIAPRRYSFVTFSTLIIKSSIISPSTYTVSMKVLSIRLNRINPIKNTRIVIIKLIT